MVEGVADPARRPPAGMATPIANSGRAGARPHMANIPAATGPEASAAEGPATRRRLPHKGGAPDFGVASLMGRPDRPYATSGGDLLRGIAGCGRHRGRIAAG